MMKMMKMMNDDDPITINTYIFTYLDFDNSWPSCLFSQRCIHCYYQYTLLCAQANELC